MLVRVVLVFFQISKLGQSLQEGELSFDDAKKMLAVVLQIYIREVLLSEDTGLPSLALEDVEDVRCNVTFLVTNSARKVMECVQSQVGGESHRVNVVHEDDGVS